MLCVRAPKLEKRLIKLAKITGKTKSYYVRTALEIYLNEQQEEVRFALSTSNEIVSDNLLIESVSNFSKIICDGQIFYNH